MEEKLSLSLFDPLLAQAPYLNTPRSLEACRMNGVNPVELVEVPFEEFRKDYPNDPDTALRRFVRVDGARRRIFNAVIEDWKRLCDSGWRPYKERPGSAKETIIPVRPEAHCELLELQAARFRKIENRQFNSLQRMLTMELKSAVKEMKNREILSKHQDIQASNDNANRERQNRREQLRNEQIAAKKRKEDEWAAELKRIQNLESDAARIKKERDKEKAKQDRVDRENKEKARLAQLDETRQRKETIMQNINADIEQKKTMQALRDQETLDRLNYQKDLLKQQNGIKSKQMLEKLNKTRKEMENAAEFKKNDIVKRMEDDEDRREQMKKRREEQREAMNKMNNDRMAQKMAKVKQISDGGTDEKVNKTLSDLEHKEMITKRELDRVRAAQENRRTIKMIHQEAYELSAMRRKKQNDYKMMKMMEAVKNKDDRCRAIREGNYQLQKMRNTMKDILGVATSVLKDEIHSLHHKDEISPERLLVRAQEVTDSVLFPNLNRKFGTVDKMSDATLMMLSASADFSSNNRATTAPPPLKESQSSLLTVDLDPRPTTKGKVKKVADPFAQNRSTKGTLPLAVLTKDSVIKGLYDSKEKVLKAEEESRRKADEEAARRKRSPMKSAGGDRDRGSYSVSPDRDRDRDRDTNHPSSSSSSSYERAKTTTPSSPTTNMSHNIDSISSSNNRNINMSVFEDSSAKEGADESALFPLFKYADDKAEKSKKKGTGDDERVLRTSNPSLRPVANGEFRRELSTDHPLAGGRGKYEKEKSKGKVAASGAKGGSKQTSAQTIERLTIEAHTKIVDPQRQLEQLRREQNEALLRVLEDERAAEEQREKTMKVVPDQQERNRLEIVFADERKRASERIIKLTKEHELRIKDAVLAMMAMKNHSSSSY